MNTTNQNPQEREASSGAKMETELSRQIKEVIDIIYTFGERITRIETKIKHLNDEIDLLREDVNAIGEKVNYW